MDAISVCSVICSPVPVSGAWKVCTYICVCICVYGLIVTVPVYKIYERSFRASPSKQNMEICIYIYRTPARRATHMQMRLSEREDQQTAPSSSSEEWHEAKVILHGGSAVLEYLSMIFPICTLRANPQDQEAVEAVPSGGGESGAG